MKERDAQLNQSEFRAEAEEILESLGSELESAEVELSQGKMRMDRVNALFRGVHSLKGLAGFLGRAELADLAHILEDYLDRLRMGELPLDSAALDLLFDTHECLDRLVRGAGIDPSVVESLRTRIGQAAAGSIGSARQSYVPGGDDSLLRSLTQYEEHRLNDSLSNGLHIHVVAVRLPFESFDSDLRSLIDRLNEGGEVISTLPSYEADEGVDQIGFRLLLASHEAAANIRKRAGIRVEVGELAGAEATTTAGGPRQVSTPGANSPGEQQDPDGTEDPLWATGRDSSVRVGVHRLDRIMNSVGELIVSRRHLATLAGRLMESKVTQELGRDLAQSTRELDKKLQDMQRSVIGARMVPVGLIVGRLSRLARKVALRAGKTVHLEAWGEGTELDKVLMDRLLSPLMHLTRNAIDHGIEEAEVRRVAGKPEDGRLLLAASQRGNSVVISLSDDGGGLDLKAIARTAVARGLLSSDATLEAEAATELICRPGFSTSSAVSEISGRGVGLDVVRREIRALKGDLRLRSHSGQGTSFEIELPITLAIIQSMLVRASEQVFAVPVTSVVETVRFHPDRLQTVARHPVLHLRGQTIPLVDLRTYFGLSRGTIPDPQYVVVSRAGQRTIALGVDALLGQQEVVVKPIGRRLENIPGIAGATEIGENLAALMLDVTSLAGDLFTVAGVA